MKILLFLLFSSICLVVASATEQPNVIIIYGDDVGWGDLSCYGAEKIQTPHLDKLASEGVRFTDGHCTAPTCSPSRFSLLTGEYAFRHELTVLPPSAPISLPSNSHPNFTI